MAKLRQPGNLTGLDTLRMSDPDRRALVTDLDDKEALTGGHESRRSKRLTDHECMSLMLQIHQPSGGPPISFQVRLRNLSRGGIGFIHGAFLYSGQKCDIPLLDRDEKLTVVTGKVVRCRFLRKTAHEVGVKFDQEIDLSRFMMEEVSSPYNASAGASKKIRGQAVVASLSAPMQVLFTHILEEAAMTTFSAPRGEDVIRLVQQVKPDILFIDLGTTPGAAVDLLKQARRGGYGRSSVAVTADDSPTARAFALSNGFNGVLVQPLAPMELERLLQSLLPASANAPKQDGVDTLESLLWRETALRPMVVAYLDHVQEQVKQMQKLVPDDLDRPRVAQLATDIKALADGYGYPLISKTARELATQCRPDAPLVAIKIEFDRLAQLCRAASAAVKPQTAKR